MIFPCKAKWYAKNICAYHDIPLLSQVSVVHIMIIIHPLLTQITKITISSQIYFKEQSNDGTHYAEKNKLGKDWVDELQLSYQSHNFHDQVLKYHCISIMSNENSLLSRCISRILSIFSGKSASYCK